MDDEYTVNGLLLPKLLIELLQSGKWRHPGDDLMRDVIPFLRDRVIFLPSVEGMRFESSGILADDDPRGFFREIRGSKCAATVVLPWLDIDKAVFIAVNLELGADVGIALDYRTSVTNPRVVANEWSSEGQFWREVTPTFTEFIERLGLQQS